MRNQRLRPRIFLAALAFLSARTAWIEPRGCMAGHKPSALAAH
jgi:hypothetical protein